MRKIKFLTKLFFLGLLLNITSCSDNEPIDPSIVINPQPDPECMQPASLQASDFIDDTMVNVSWEAGGNETAWEVQYGVGGFSPGSGTTVLSDDTNVTIASLNSGSNYNFYVRAICGPNSFSDWTGPVSVNSSNEDCPNPGAVTAVRTATVNTTVDVTWTAGGTEGAWEIQYGAQGFSIGDGTIVPATTTVKQVAGIAATGTFDFYVRAICSSTDTSSWVGPITVSPAGTTPTGFTYMNANIDGVQHNNMKPMLYPVSGAMAALTSFSGETEEPELALRIQGNTDALNPGSSNFAEITLILHKDYWTPGTYTLISTDDQVTWPAATVNLIMVNATNSWTVYENELPGTITVTEFDTVNKRIKGTFTFTYELSDEGDVTGPFTVTGNFDFPVDPDAFE
ncbi:MAG TPA: fibronectin type III domain-containing protein [Flavobacterium sp.]|jgi:hypothetical protein